MAEQPTFEIPELPEMLIEDSGFEKMRQKIIERLIKHQYENREIELLRQAVVFYAKQSQSLEQQLAELREKYSDLIMEVAHKIPDESCHDTAKRYIREREHRELEPQQALNTTSKEG